MGIVCAACLLKYQYYYVIILVFNLIRFCCDMCPQSNGKNHSKWCTKDWVPPIKRPRFSMNHPDKDDGGYTDQVVNLLKEVKAFNFIATKEDVNSNMSKVSKGSLKTLTVFGCRLHLPACLSRKTEE